LVGSGHAEGKGNHSKEEEEKAVRRKEREKSFQSVTNFFNNPLCVCVCVCRLRKHNKSQVELVTKTKKFLISLFFNKIIDDCVLNGLLT